MPFFLMFVGYAAIIYWKVTLAILAYLTLRGGVWLYRQKKAAQREAERLQRELLIKHADREHRLVQQGDMDGIYGSYPVPDVTRGIGIWLCDDKKRPRQEDGAA